MRIAREFSSVEGVRRRGRPRQPVPSFRASPHDEARVPWRDGTDRRVSSSLKTGFVSSGEHLPISQNSHNGAVRVAVGISDLAGRGALAGNVTVNDRASGQGRGMGCPSGTGGHPGGDVFAAPDAAVAMSKAPVAKVPRRAAVIDDVRGGSAAPVANEGVRRHEDCRCDTSARPRRCQRRLAIPPPVPTAMPLTRRGTTVMTSKGADWHRQFGPSAGWPEPSVGP